MNFNLIEYENFNEIVSASHVATNLWEANTSNFGIIPKKSVQYYLKR